MEKRLLLISNSTNFGEPYLTYTKPYIKDFLGGNPMDVLFIPYAGVTVTYDEYTQKVSDVFTELGYTVKSIHKAENPTKAVEQAKCIVVGGGNTFHLVHMLHENNLIEPLRKKINEGTPFIGWSAGSNVACPSLKTTNDMPVIQPKSFNVLGVIPFQINPHYTEATLPNHAGETREQRLREFLVVNPDITVVGLPEGTMLRIEGKSVRLQGPKKIKVIKKDVPSVEYDETANLDFLLK
ncbi:MAG: dipeptidase PepE [Bacteroidetes bacterium]|nr:dipeptidase PepE [Bacteroidota bacterium]